MTTNSFWLSPLILHIDYWMPDWILQTSSAAAEQPESSLSPSNIRARRGRHQHGQANWWVRRTQVIAEMQALYEEEPSMFVRVFHGFVSAPFKCGCPASNHPALLPPAVALQFSASSRKCPIGIGFIPNRDCASRLGILTVFPPVCVFPGNVLAPSEPVIRPCPSPRQTMRRMKVALNPLSAVN